MGNFVNQHTTIHGVSLLIHWNHEPVRPHHNGAVSKHTGGNVNTFVESHFPNWTLTSIAKHYKPLSLVESPGKNRHQDYIKLNGTCLKTTHTINTDCPTHLTAPLLFRYIPQKTCR